MQKRYDVCIIGAGEAGLCAAYELKKKAPFLSIVIIEQGNEISKRNCPKNDKKIGVCANCNPCNIMKGLGGAGGHSDGKFNITDEYGGNLLDYISSDELIDLLNYVDSINIEFGATDEITDHNNDFVKSFKKKILIEHELQLLTGKVKHYGTDKNKEILTKFYNYLVENGVEFLFNTKVEEISACYSLDLSNGEKVYCDYLIAAPGRAGSAWLSEQCKKLGIKVSNNQVDIGVRVEVPAEVLEDITNVMYEAKIRYRTKCHGHNVRTFCMNPNGFVVNENVDGIVTVNGHSNSKDGKKSKNTNFALLVSLSFTEPFKEPNKYGRAIASTMNMLAGGDVIVQRFGDLKAGKRSTEKKLKDCSLIPTLKAVAGDLGLAMPKEPLEDIIETLEVLNKAIPGIANDDTLLYGIEVKFYSDRLETNEKLEVCGYQNFYAVGDGAGVTRGLAQAGASGIIAARDIVSNVLEDPHYIDKKAEYEKALEEKRIAEENSEQLAPDVAKAVAKFNAYLEEDIDD